MRRLQLRIVEAFLGVNDNRKRAMARKVSNAVGGSLRGGTVAVLGLTFKPDTDDMREAPSILLVTGLLEMGAKGRARDPVGMKQGRRELPDIEYCDDPYTCVRGADALVIVTEWTKFSLSGRHRRAVAHRVQARQQHFDVFTMNCGPCSISIEQDADAVGVDASSDNRARLVGEAHTA